MSRQKGGIVNRTDLPARAQDGSSVAKNITAPALAATAVVAANLAAHLANLLNPHATTAAQVGAPTLAALATDVANLAAHIANVANPHAVTKAQVGLGAVPNTDFTTHETRHRSGGADPLSVLNLAGFPGGVANFLRADGSFAAPAGGGITPSYAQVYNSAAQNLTTGAWNVLTFDSEDIDTDSYHAPGDPTKLTAPATGFYMVWGQCANIAPSGVGSRGVWVNRNGDVTLTLPGMFVFFPPVAAIYGTFPEILLGMPMTAGDYIQIQAFQDSGGTLSSGGGGGIRSQQNMFGIHRIA